MEENLDEGIFGEKPIDRALLEEVGEVGDVGDLGRGRSPGSGWVVSAQQWWGKGMLVGSHACVGFGPY